MPAPKLAYPRPAAEGNVVRPHDLWPAIVPPVNDADEVAATTRFERLELLPAPAPGQLEPTEIVERSAQSSLEDVFIKIARSGDIEE